jgi:hypothetical protein
MLDPLTLRRAPQAVSQDEGVPAPQTVRRKNKAIPYLLGAGIVVAIVIGVAVAVSMMVSSSDETSAKLQKFEKEKEAIIANKLNFVSVKHRRWLKATPDFTDADMRTILPYRGQFANLSLESSVVEGKNLSVLKNCDLLGLDLTRTRITNDSLEEVGKLTTLEILVLNLNNIDDSGIAHLQNLSHLNELHLREAGITDQGMEMISHFSNLRLLDVDECNKLTNKSFEYLLRLKKLKGVTIKNCDKITNDAIDRYNTTTKGSVDIDGRHWKGEDLTEGQRVFQRMQAVQADLDADPEFAKFFQDPKNWNRKNYDDVKNPRILKWVKDPEMQKYMRNPEIQKRWQKKDTWKKFSDMSKRFKEGLTDLQRFDITDDSLSRLHDDDKTNDHHRDHRNSE